jgi:hypothetical protein
MGAIVETVAVILVVGAAAILILRSLVRGLKGRSGCGGCSDKCELKSDYCDKEQ